MKKSNENIMHSGSEESSEKNEFVDFGVLENTVEQETVLELSAVELSAIENNVDVVEQDPRYPTAGNIKEVTDVLAKPDMKNLLNNVLIHLDPHNNSGKYAVVKHMKILKKALNNHPDVTSEKEVVGYKKIGLKPSGNDKIIQSADGEIAIPIPYFGKSIREMAINEALAANEELQKATLNFLMQGFIEYVDDYKELRVTLSGLLDSDEKLYKVLNSKQRSYLRAWKEKNPVKDYGVRLDKVIKAFGGGEEGSEVLLKLLSTKDPYTGDSYVDKLQQLFKVYISDAALFDDEFVFNNRVEQFDDFRIMKPSNISYGGEVPLLGDVDNTQTITDFLDMIKVY